MTICRPETDQDQALAPAVEGQRVRFICRAESESARCRGARDCPAAKHIASRSFGQQYHSLQLDIFTMSFSGSKSQVIAKRLPEAFLVIVFVKMQVKVDGDAGKHAMPMRTGNACAKGRD